MFGKSWPILRVRGIPIKIHVSLLLFLPYVAFVAGLQYRSLARSMGIDPSAGAMPPLGWGILLAIGLFVAVTLHELAHSLVALKSGLRVRSITLTMLGGISSIEHDVAPPHEAWMAFVGPLVSLLIAVASFLLCRLTAPLADLSVAFLWFALTNGLVGAFNLLPAFPMDGGRVLRGLLASRVGIVRATDIATRTGQVLAIVFALWAFLNFNLMLMLIAGFIYLGAAAERARFNTRDVLHGLPVSQFMNDRLGDAYAGERAADVASRLLANNLIGARVASGRASSAFETRPATDDGIPSLGVVTAWDLAPDGRSNPSIGEKVHSDLPRVNSNEDASRALDMFLGGQTSAVVVVDQDQRIVGLLTQDDVKRALALANAMGYGRAKSAAR
jgi:Zn-dependent protease